MKKKIFTLLTLLVCLCTGAWGTEVTETYDFLTWAGSGDATITASSTKVTNASSIELTVGTAIGANSLNSRFAFCNISNGSSFGWRLRQDTRAGYGYQYGLYTQGYSPNWGPF